ncbi:MAG: glutamate-1-semialdehyde 2,1-aminomutase [Candidatus Omnitrophica bacterium]|nr:glutamate-1-semialdehyde 2,1-aminomutase [Candidatus Omnitrophota bacterium]
MRQSEQLFKEAQKHIPGGVNSPVRAFRAVGGVPRFIQKGKGSSIWDVDGKRYLDFVMSWGPLILGHADSGVARAISKQAKLGTSYGAPTKNEVELSEVIKSAFPSIEKVRLVSSGTEAVMSAIRLARGVSGRKKIVKCDGCYHGHVDSLLVRAGSGVATFGRADSGGIPEELAKLTFSIPYNDVEALERLLKKHAREIACFILEPVPANMGVVLPNKNYLKQIRALTKRYGVLLIFDEVITGFRIAFGGTQERFGVQADLTCLGKILGGGLPIGAFGGRKELMNHLAPEGDVYQAGTLSGNPIATRAGLETLNQLRRPHFYQDLESKSNRFCEFLDSEIEKYSLPVKLNRIGSCFTLFFTSTPVTDFASAKRSNVKRFARYFHRLLSQGIYVAPSQFEANFISMAHKNSDLIQTGKMISKILRML